jgi:hypothetical protein
MADGVEGFCSTMHWRLESKTGWWWRRRLEHGEEDNAITEYFSLEQQKEKSLPAGLN